jgi:hypothetical protein
VGGPTGTVPEARRPGHKKEAATRCNKKMKKLCLLLGIFSYIQSFEHVRHKIPINHTRLNETDCGCFDPSGRHAAPAISCVRAMAWMALNIRPPRPEFLAACLVAANSIGNLSSGLHNAATAFLLDSSGYHRSGDEVSR